MNSSEATDKLFTVLSSRLDKLGIEADDIDQSTSLLEQGVLDSLGFIEFITNIEITFDIEFDFEDMDANDFTSIEQLVQLVLNK